MKTSTMDFALFVDIGDEENSNKSNSHHHHHRPPPTTFFHPSIIHLPKWSLE